MKYTVVWLPTAEARLADIWNQAADRQEVANASDRIEQELRRDAPQKGAPLGDCRHYADAPLAVTFHVSPDDRMVTVIEVERV